MGEISNTLNEAGDGLGGLLDGIDNPIGNLVILLGIASLVIGLLMAIAYSIKHSMGA